MRVGDRGEGGGQRWGTEVRVGERGDGGGQK